MVNRTRYDDKMLEYCREKAGQTIEIINTVLVGEKSLGRAAHDAGFDAIGFRKVLSILESIEDPRPKETPADVAVYRSAEEMFYGDVFCVSIDDYDEMWSMIPADSAHVMQWIYEGAGGLLTNREGMFIKNRYDDNMTLEDMAKKYGVTRERVRQIISKSIRKMRRPLVKRILCYGMDVYDEVRNEYQLQKEEIIRGIVDEKMKIDGDIKAAEGMLEDPQKPLVDCSGILDTRIDDLGLSVRSYNCLARAGFKTVRDLAEIRSIDSLFRIRNLGRKSGKEIRAKLLEIGVRCPVTEENYE